MNLNEYRERFCEYMLHRYAWENGFLEEPFSQNRYEYYDSLSKVYCYLIKKIGYQVVYCGITTMAEEILKPILGDCRMKYAQYRDLLKLYDQDGPCLMLVVQSNHQTDKRGLNVFGNVLDGCGYYISYNVYKGNGPAWQACRQEAKIELCCRLKEEKSWKF